MSLFGKLGPAIEQSYNDPMFRIGLGLLGRPQQRVGRALSGAFDDYAQFQMQQQILQNRQQANQIRQAEETRRARAEKAEQEALARQLAAMEELKQIDPKMATMAQAAPNAIPAFAQSLYRSPTEAPSAVREWKYFSGLSAPEQEQYLTLRRGQKYQDLGPTVVPLPQRSPYSEGTPGSGPDALPMPAGYEKGLEPHQEPDVRAAQTTAVEEAKQAVEKQGNRSKAFGALNTFNRQASIAKKNIDDVIGLYGNWTAWTPDFIASLPKSKVRAIENKLKTIKANIGFQALQEMRKNSPTGGALGQVAVQELEGLQATLGAMDWRDSEFIPTLQAIRGVLEQMSVDAQAAFDMDYGSGWSIKEVK